MDTVVVSQLHRPKRAVGQDLWRMGHVTGRFTIKRPKVERDYGYMGGVD
jgi:hypothetical protein